MAIVWKTVKPARLKEDAFRLYMLNAMRKSGTEIKAEYAKTVKTWKHKPVFKTLVSLTGAQFTVLVDTEDKIFGYVDLGTRPHIIRPRKQGGVLRWNSRSYAKTFPGVLGSAAGYAGGEAAYATVVHHPGTEAREFTANIEKIYRPKFRKQCEEAMRQFARGSGHYAGRR